MSDSACVRACTLCVSVHHACVFIFGIFTFITVITVLYICTGLNDADQFGESLIERQVPWVVPDHLYSSTPPLQPNDEEEFYEDYEVEKKVSNNRSKHSSNMTFFFCLYIELPNLSSSRIQHCNNLVNWYIDILL